MVSVILGGHKIWSSEPPCYCLKYPLCRSTYSLFCMQSCYLVSLHILLHEIPWL